MNDQEFELFLQRELKAQNDYIADDGFTDALMAQLPAKPDREKAKPNRLVVWAAILSTVLVAAILPLQAMLQGFASIFTQPSANWATLLGLGLSMLAVAALVVWNDRTRIFEV
ncbi:DUF5056 domain-containing protein [uncultured Pseudoteredinibacter sp.]|uniref:DUF5056 domain-containing protein n=1 Tax=uncultured Pseudoteredinibacter sp. TaxID=1641701 RepID=UPI002614F097|nr:DUF5056 domain-containing protein [uncultured Pseudoteredinibacter sp.]